MVKTFTYYEQHFVGCLVAICHATALSELKVLYEVLSNIPELSTRITLTNEGIEDVSELDPISLHMCLIR